MSKQKRIHRDWSAVLAKFDQSGQPVRSFCTTHGINEGLFHRWRRRLRSVVPQATGGFVEVGPDVSAEGSGVAICAVGGLRIELGRGFDARVLERVLACLVRSDQCSR